MRGLSDLVLSVTQPEIYGAGLFKNVVSGLVPQSGFVNAVTKEIDPTMREYSTSLEYVKTRVVGMGKDLPPKRNLWGEPILLDGGLGPDIVSPFYTSKGTNSPIDEECYRLGVTPGMPGKRIKIGKEMRELTKQELDRYILIMNNTKIDGKRNLKEYLNRMVTEDKQYKKDNDEVKRKKIEIVISKLRDVAKKTLVQMIEKEEKNKQ